MHCIREMSFLHFVPFFLLTQIHGKSIPLYHDLAFQDLSPGEVDQDVTALRKGQAPIIQSLRGQNSRKNGNILWGFEQKWIELKCHAKASPVAEFRWKFRGLTIDPEAAHADTLIISGHDNLSILKVKVQESTLGEYTCRSSNELGASEMNFFLRRAAKPLTPDFNTIVVPNSGILVEVTAFHNNHRKHLHILETHGFKDRDELGEILPFRGYVIQMRKMRSCDPWRNITMNSEKKFLRHHLVGGTIYRMRLAARTEAGVGEFSRAKTVNYRLPEPISDSEENLDQTTTSYSPAENDDVVVSNETEKSLEEGEYSEEQGSRNGRSRYLGSIL